MDPNGGFILFHVFLLNGASRGMAFNDLPKKNHLRFVNKGFTPPIYGHFWKYDDEAVDFREPDGTTQGNFVNYWRKKNIWPSPCEATNDSTNDNSGPKRMH